MKVGDVFVELGIQGGNQAKQVTTETTKGLKDVWSSGLAAKAAILGVVYGLERMMAHSTETGTSMMNFNAITGMSLKTLQQLQYAAKIAGVDNRNFMGSLEDLQQKMVEMSTNGGAPGGMSIVAQTLGLTSKDLARMKKDTYYLFEQLSKFAQHTEIPPQYRAKYLRDFIGDKDTIAAMMRGAFTPDILNKAPVLSDSVLKQNNKVGVIWDRMSQKVQNAIAVFTAKNGANIVKDVDEIAEAVIRLANALERVAEDTKVFKIMGWIFDHIANAGNAAADEMDRYNTPSKNDADMKGLGWSPKDMVERFARLRAAAAAEENHPTKLPVHPGAGGKGDVNINQTIHHHGDAKDTKAVKDTHKMAAKHAFRMSHAAKGG